MALFDYDVSVTNNSDETVWLTSLIDTKFGDLDGQGDCVADGSVAIAAGASYACSFSATVNGNAGFSHQNTVVATVVDDEGSDASNFDDETVTHHGRPAERRSSTRRSLPARSSPARR